MTFSVLGWCPVTNQFGVPHAPEKPVPAKAGTKRFSGESMRKKKGDTER